MLTVEQVRNLDGKVRKALTLIETLKSENSMLTAKLDEYKQRVEQLDSVVDGFKLEQLEIEEGIKDVLTQLDILEDKITEPAPSAQASVVSEEKPAEQTPAPESQPAPVQSAPAAETVDPVETAEAEEKPPELEIF